MKKYIVVFVLMLLCVYTTAQNFSSVKIGKQQWMTQNIDVDTFRNGEIILEAKTKEEWEEAGNKKQPAWCYYKNDSSHGARYGKLYNWYAVMDPRGLAPGGWHIATDAEWSTLIKYLGEDSAGVKMKSKVGWVKAANGINSSGFSALPGGMRNYDGLFLNIGEQAIWWSADGNNTSDRYIEAFIVHIGRLSTGSKKNGLSVRCIKD